MSDVDLSKLSEADLKELQKKVKKFRLEEKNIEGDSSSNAVSTEGKRESDSDDSRTQSIDSVSSALRLPRWYWELRGGE